MAMMFKTRSVFDDDEEYSEKKEKKKNKNAPYLIESIGIRPVVNGFTVTANGKKDKEWCEETFVCEDYDSLMETLKKVLKG